MNNSCFKVIVFFYIFRVFSAHADSIAHRSEETIIAESEEFLAVHSHLVKGSEIDYSTILFADKKLGPVKFLSLISPMTYLVSLLGEDGKTYFAGLSYLKAGSLEQGYNFALFSSQGDLITREFVFHKSGHCRVVRESVSNFARWFNEKEPAVKLEFEDSKISRVLVENPYDVGPSGELGFCEIKVDY